MPISGQTYKRVALEDPDGPWELVCGRLRSKPDMTIEHDDTAARLAQELMLQLDRREYGVRIERPRLRVSTGSHFIPDVCVVPRALVERKRREQPRQLEVYEEPMPLVVEVWSPSTGEYDVEEKLREYRLRRDQEIWRIHPYDKTLTAWRLRPDGSYVESFLTAGSVQPAFLPNVSIDLAPLFE